MTYGIIFIGTILIALGGMLATLGWNNYFTPMETRTSIKGSWIYKNAVSCIIIGTISITLGGFVATYGWNLKTSKEIRILVEENRLHERELQREGILKTVLMEVINNIFRIQGKKIAETDEKELSKFVVFPRLGTAALSSALESTLFLEKKDRKFFDSVNNLKSKLTGFNHRLDMTETLMRTNANQISYIRNKLRDGLARQSTLRELEQCLNIIFDNYEDWVSGWIKSEFGDETDTIINMFQSQMKQN